MNPRERLLGMGKLYLMRGEPIPLDILVEAEAHGLLLEDFGEPLNLGEGEKNDSEANLRHSERHSSLPLHHES